MDNDRDGLINAAEFFLGTSINDPDSDGDSIIDGIDREPTRYSNACSGSDAVLSLIEVLAGEIVVCAASGSVRVAGDVRIHDGGFLELISPSSGLAQGFRVDLGGSMNTILRDPLALLP